MRYRRTALGLWLGLIGAVAYACWCLDVILGRK